MFQSVLHFQYQEEFIEDDYIVSESNQEAYNILNDWHNNWGVKPYPSILALTGPKGSGKTHLINFKKRIFEAVTIDTNSRHLFEELEKNNFFIIENIDSSETNSENLLHVFNLCHEKQKVLLLTSSVEISKINFQLKDLDSRIKSIKEVKILEPDDNIIKIILFKHFTKRSIKIENNIINYLAKILPRNFYDINQKIELIDQESLKAKKDITIPFLRKLFNL